MDELFVVTARDRRKKTAARAKRWIEEASLGTGHKATKSKDSVLAPTVSADKTHTGDVLAQLAADKGGLEEGKVP